MPLLPFAQLVRAEGLSSGLSDDQLAFVLNETRAGTPCADLLQAPVLASLGLQPIHLMQLRRRMRRFFRLEADAKPAPDCAAVPVRDRLGMRAARWAMRLSPDDTERRRDLCLAFSAVAVVTLKGGSLRMHLNRPGDPRNAEWADLAEHTEACADIPPHRWFKASRALADGLLTVRVRVPEGETRRALAGLASDDLIAELEQAVSRPVLDAIAIRSEDKVIASASQALLDLLARPALSGPVAGLAIDARRIRACIRLAPDEDRLREFDLSDFDGLLTWLKAAAVESVGLARLSGAGELSGLIRALAGSSLAVEPVSPAGLMRQARGHLGGLKMAAAAVVAHRLQDPLAGYAGLEPDQLGLGEYLDRVDADLLRASLEDARDAAAWTRLSTAANPLAVRAPARSNASQAVIQDLADLRPGMELVGTVVNLTHFGAFVELGFAVQGLIHLSELADHFVDHPSAVVQVGQQVRARVLAYDSERGRLSLSLRGGRPGRAKARDQRATALKDLDRLFRK